MNTSKNTCIIDDCEKPRKGRGLCSTHHSYYTRNGTIDQVGLPSRLNPSVPHRLTEINPATRTAQCSECGSVKVKHSTTSRGDYWTCMTKVKQHSKASYDRFKQNNPGHKWPTKETKPRYVYGEGDVVDYKEALKARAKFQEEQEGKCKICLRETTLHLDHCHSTGKLRGLLCVSCNTALGKLQDDPERLERAAQYLRDTA